MLQLVEEIRTLGRSQEDAACLQEVSTESLFLRIRSPLPPGSRTQTLRVQYHPRSRQIAVWGAPKGQT